MMGARRAFALSESPLWDVEEQRLYWVDWLNPAVHSSDVNGTERRTWQLPQPVGSLALRRDGGAIVALRDGFYALDFATGEIELRAGLPNRDKRVRINDGKVDRQGRFVAGSMDNAQREPIGSLFRVDLDWSVATLDMGLILTNGPCWNPDGSRFYFADTVTRQIYVYDYDTSNGTSLSKGIFADFATLGLHGVPDGAAVDTEGFVWSVEGACGRLIRFSPDGVIDRIVGLPVEYSTSVIFGGPNLDIAFITSIGRRSADRGLANAKPGSCSLSMG